MTQHSTAEERQRAVALYQQGWSGPDIGRALGRSHYFIYCWLRRAGVLRREQTDAQRIYALDDKYFATIDTEEKAYWLGFITADGNVISNRKQGGLTVNLKRGDREHLCKLVAALRSDLPILDYEVTIDGVPRQMSRAIFNSRRLSDALIALGVGPRKSLASEPWHGPPELMRHYWRGVLDGDGWVTKEARRAEAFKGAGAYDSVVWVIGLCGTCAVVQGFADFVAANGCPQKHPRKHSSIFRVTYAGCDLPRMVASIFYEGATVALDRKMALAGELLATAPRQKCLRAVTQETLALLFGQYGCWDEVALHLGCHISGLRNLRKRLGMPTRPQRRRLYMPPGLTKERLERLYREHGSWNAVAAALCVRRNALFPVLRKLRVAFIRAREVT